MLYLDSLPIAPEDVEPELLDRLSERAKDPSNMSLRERRFVNGLVRTYRPKKILEIGVSRGGGTCTLLNAIDDMPDTTVTSIDVAEFAGDNEIGCYAKGLYLSNQQWHLIAGKDPVEVIETLEGSFDFVVLDTAHVHPIESLNFLTVFPYLTPDAVVVLHDVNRFAPVWSHLACYTAPPFACKLLYDTVTAKKLEPLSDGRANIGAFQLLPYTKDHIEDVFSMLSFPWGRFPRAADTLDDFISRHYSEKNYKLFRHALRQARTLQWDYKTGFSPRSIGKDAIERIKARFNDILKKKRFIFYAAGYNSKQLLEFFKKNDIRLPDEIWDTMADKIVSISGIPVVTPDFESLNNDDCGMIITNSLSDVVLEIIEKNKDAGFTEYLTLNAIWAFGQPDGNNIFEICSELGIDVRAVRENTGLAEQYC